MTITLELSTDQERLLREGAASADAAAMRQVLLQAIDSTIERMLRIASKPAPRPDSSAMVDGVTEVPGATVRPDHSDTVVREDTPI
jgi:hypothetical protein